MRPIWHMSLKMVLGATVLVGGSTLPATASQPTATCQFVLGFKTLRDLIPDRVGECVEDEWHNPENGDGLQRTTTHGLMVWRKADNWTAFTDGTNTWINGPLGLQVRLNGERFPWEASLAQPQPPPPAAPSSPTLPPGSEAMVQRAVADAAQRTGLDPAAIRVLTVEEREWSDASLGCPRPGEFSAQVITAGFRIVLEAGGRRLEYHTDRRSESRLC